MIRLFLVSFFFSAYAFAVLAPRMRGVVTQATGNFSQSTDTSNEKFLNTRGSLEALYLIPDGPAVGVRGFYESRDESVSENGYSYGPSVGFYSYSGVFLLGHYDFGATLGKWMDGSGYQVDLGYVEHISNSYHIGVQLSHRSTTYKKHETDTTAQEKIVKESFPSLVLMYLF